jgi:hypothetical protein
MLLFFKVIADMYCDISKEKNHIPGKDRVFLVVLGNSSKNNFDMAV